MRSNTFKYVFVITLIIILILLRLCIGNEIYSISEVVQTLVGNGNSQETFNILCLRLPIIVGAIIFGTIISLSGYMLQTVTKNNLAEPSILGVTTFVVFSQLVINLILNIDIGLFLNIIVLTLFISLFLLIILNISRVGNMISTKKLILFGIGSNLFINSLIIFIKSYVDQQKYEEIVVLQNGSLDYFDMQYLLFYLVVIILLYLYLFINRNKYKLLILDSSALQSKGLDYNVFLIENILLISFITVVSVLSIGVIILLGLITPQISKILFKNSFINIIIFSPLLAIIILIVSDLISKYLFGFVVPLNIVVSLSLIPLYLIILFRKEIL